MEVIYGLIPGMILIGLIAVAVLFWAARTGQFDDLKGDAQRILMDDDEGPTDQAPNGGAESVKGDKTEAGEIR